MTAYTSSAAAAAAGGTTTYGAPLPPVSSPLPLHLKLGLSFVPTTTNAFSLPTAESLDHVRSLGVGRIRVLLPWSWLQPALSAAPTTERLQELSRFYNLCQSKSIRVLLGIADAGGPNGSTITSTPSFPVSLLTSLWAPVMRTLRIHPQSDGFELLQAPTSALISNAQWAAAMGEAILVLRRTDATSLFHVNGAGTPQLLNTNFHVSDVSNRTVNNVSFAQASLRAPATVDLTAVDKFSAWLQAYQYQGTINSFTPSEATAPAIEAAAEILESALRVAPVFLHYSLVQPTYHRDSGRAVDSAYGALIRRITGEVSTALLLEAPGAPFCGEPGIPSAPIAVRYAGFLGAATNVTLTDSGAGGTFTPSSLVLHPGFNPKATFTYSNTRALTATISAMTASGLSASPLGYATRRSTLDANSAVTHAYALRRLMFSYVGPGIRVVRPHDGLEFDVLFRSDDHLDLETASAFSHGAPLRVLTVYDQSPYRNHLTCPTGRADPGALPILVMADADGYPSIDFNGNNVLSARSALKGLTSASFFVHARSTAEGGAAVCVNNGSRISVLDQGCIVVTDCAQQVLPIVKEDGAFHSYALTVRASASQGRAAFLDGVSKGKAPTSFITLNSRGTVANDKLHVGWFPDWEGSYWKGELRELVVTNSYTFDADVLAISTETRARYDTAAPYRPTPTTAYSLPATFEFAAPEYAVEPVASLTGWNVFTGLARSYFPEAALQVEYSYPDLQYLQGVLDANPGFNAVRIAFLPSRIQRSAGGSLVLAELMVLHRTVQFLHAQGKNVILQAYDNGLYFGGLADTPSAPGAYADMWKRLDRAWKHWPNVAFSIAHDPSLHTAAEWTAAAQAAVQSIHSATSTRNVLVPLRDSALPSDSWRALRNEHVLFDTERFNDAQHAGASAQCTLENPAEVYGAVVGWMRHNGFRAVLSTAFSAAPSCIVPRQRLLAYVNTNADVFAGITYGHRTHPALQFA